MTNQPRRRHRGRTIIDEYQQSNEIKEIPKYPNGRFYSLLALTRDSLFVFGGNASMMDQFAGTYCWRCNRVSHQWSMVPVQVIGEAHKKILRFPSIFNGCSIPAEDRVDGPLFLYANAYGDADIFMVSLAFNERNEEVLFLELLTIEDEDGSFVRDKIQFSGSSFMTTHTNVQLLCANPNKFYCISNCHRTMKFGLPDDDDYPIFQIYEFERNKHNDSKIWKWRKLATEGEREYRQDFEFLALNDAICTLFQNNAEENFLCFIARKHYHQKYADGQPHILSKVLFFDLNQSAFFMSSVKCPTDDDVFPKEPWLFEHSAKCVLRNGNSSFWCFFGEYELLKEKQPDESIRVEHDFKHQVFWSLDLTKMEWRRRELGLFMRYGMDATAICDQLTKTIYIFGGYIPRTHNYQSLNGLMKIRIEVATLKEIAMGVLAQNYAAFNESEKQEFEPKLSDPRACARFYKKFYV